jgi:predicted FMN-binding regulatory protein PaiB
VQAEPARAAYPPAPRRVAEPGPALALMRAQPFAHFFTAGGGLRATRVPLLVEEEAGRPVRLRGHLNAQNPQAAALDGAPVLVVFPGRAAYVSPHWRASPTRAGTYDYEEVRVHGTARRVEGIGFFRRLIDDLSALIEPQHAEVGDYPVWRTEMAPPGYVERLFPMIACFVIEIEAVEMISKLHQHFPPEDRRAIAAHLARSAREDSRAIGELIRRGL